MTSDEWFALSFVLCTSYFVLAAAYGRRPEYVKERIPRTRASRPRPDNVADSRRDAVNQTTIILWQIYCGNVKTKWKRERGAEGVAPPGWAAPRLPSIGDRLSKRI